MEQKVKLNPETTVIIGKKQYDVQFAVSDEEKEQGLSKLAALPKDQGMLFVYDEPQEELYYTCEEMEFPIDIIFLNEDLEVIDVFEMDAHDPDLAMSKNAQYVLEVNAKSGIEEGEELEMEDDDFTDSEKEDIKHSKMLVLDENGDVQMKLFGGERIVSRIETRKLIKAALKAFHSDEDTDYKKVGTLIFKILDGQDSREPEYVTLKD